MDLIERLREHASTHSDSKDLLYAAADEIERLRGGSEDDLEPPVGDDPEAWSRYVGSLFARIEARTGMPPGSLTSLSITDPDPGPVAIQVDWGDGEGGTGESGEPVM